MPTFSLPNPLPFLGNTPDSFKAKAETRILPLAFAIALLRFESIDDLNVWLESQG
jgi:hypothetical protein